MANETDLPDFDDVEMESPMEEVHADPRDEEIIVLKEEAAALKDRLLRLAAEMENLRKAHRAREGRSHPLCRLEFRPRSFERGR